MNSYQLEILPHLLQQTVVVPLVMRGDGDTMGDLGVKNVKEGHLKAFDFYSDLGDDLQLFN